MQTTFLGNFHRPEIMGINYNHTMDNDAEATLADALTKISLCDVTKSEVTKPREISIYIPSNFDNSEVDIGREL